MRFSYDQMRSYEDQRQIFQLQESVEAQDDLLGINPKCLTKNKLLVYGIKEQS